MADNGSLLNVARALYETGQAIQRAALSGDALALPGLVEQEKSLVEELTRALSAQAPPPALREQLRALVGAWWGLHRQNRILIHHAHRTVAELIARLSGAMPQPAGLYQAGPEAALAARVDRTA